MINIKFYCSIRCFVSGIYDHTVFIYKNNWIVHFWLKTIEIRVYVNGFASQINLLCYCCQLDHRERYRPRLDHVLVKFTVDILDISKIKTGSWRQDTSSWSTQTWKLRLVLYNKVSYRVWASLEQVFLVFKDLASKTKVTFQNRPCFGRCAVNVTSLLRWC